ncbi:MAG: ABC transporter ATP-binding protein [Sulfitobacter sp.]|nr:ABC transporter ATP-binding protein [Sulfitobacter sp.]
MSETAPLIELADLRFAPEGRAVLEGISLRTQAQRIGVVGRNGSGKSTLVRLVAGLEPGAEGQVRIGGVDPLSDRKGALGAVGILFQNPDHQIIFPTVEEELAFGLRQMGLGKAAVQERVAATLDRFGRSHWTSAAIHQLSQGQRQLVCLMAVLAMAPKVILLDEPFSGLDIPTRLHLQRVLAGINATLVQVTHDPATVADHDLILWLEEGRIARQGPPDTVLPEYRARMEEIGGSDDFTHLAC